jgi:hypothetical protein
MLQASKKSFLYIIDPICLENKTSPDVDTKINDEKRLNTTEKKLFDSSLPKLSTDEIYQAVIKIVASIDNIEGILYATEYIPTIEAENKTRIKNLSIALLTHQLIELGTIGKEYFSNFFKKLILMFDTLTTSLYIFSFEIIIIIIVMCATKKETIYPIIPKSKTTRSSTFSNIVTSVLIIPDIENNLSLFKPFVYWRRTK